MMITKREIRVQKDDFELTRSGQENAILRMEAGSKGNLLIGSWD